MDRPGVPSQRRLHAAQFCHYFGVWRSGAQRFVQTLLDRRAAVETDVIAFNGGGKTCRISSNAIYRALGVENIRHRRKASNPVVMRAAFVP